MLSNGCKVTGMALLIVSISSCGPKWKESGTGTVKTVNQEGGQTLGYSTSSGVKILTADRKAFKDLNKNGQLDRYEDWRLSADDRAKDLASKLSVEQIAGLMLYSRHQAIPSGSRGFMAGTYNGNPSKKVAPNLLTYPISKRIFSPKTT